MAHAFTVLALSLCVCGGGQGRGGAVKELVMAVGTRHINQAG